jgi:DNA-binding NarL/FixJ family response regulator
MDIRMPDMDGLEATRAIVGDAGLSEVKVVILTTFDLDEYVYGALRAGASGFMVKDTEPLELIHAVRVVARGDALIAPSVTRRLIAEIAGRRERPAPSPHLNALTDREREVMVLVAAGLSNDEIAEQLVLSPATAKTHVSRAMIKLNARDRAQLVVFAYESGLVSPGRAPQTNSKSTHNFFFLLDRGISTCYIHNMLVHESLVTVGWCASRAKMTRVT